MWVRELRCSVCGRHIDVPGGKVHGQYACKRCFHLFLDDRKSSDMTYPAVDWVNPGMTSEEMLGQIERELKESAALEAMSGLNRIEKLMELGERDRRSALATAALLKMVRALVIQNQLLLTSGIGSGKLASQTKHLVDYLRGQQGDDHQAR